MKNKGNSYSKLSPSQSFYARVLEVLCDGCLRVADTQWKRAPRGISLRLYRQW